MKKIYTAALAAVIMLMGMLVMASPAEAVVCDKKVSKQTHWKTANVATSLQKTAGHDRYRRVKVTTIVRYAKCYGTGGQYLYSSINGVSVKYLSQKNNFYLGKSTTGGWVRNWLNCYDGVRDDNWFKKVEVIWFNEGLGGWNPPDYTIGCVANGVNQVSRSAPASTRVYPSNTTKWRAKTSVVREGLRLNYRATHTGLVR